MNELILGRRNFRVARRSLVTSCETFLQDPALLAKPYTVQSPVRPESFQTFLDAIGGASAKITSHNVSELELLCQEFAFTDLTVKVADYLSEHAAIDVDARRDVELLREGQLQHERELSDLRQDGCGREVSIAAMQSDVSALRRQVDEFHGQIARLADEMSDLGRKVSQLEREAKIKESSHTRQVDEVSATLAHQARQISELQAADESIAKEVSSLRGQKGTAGGIEALRELFGVRHVEPSDGRPLGGIISYLTKKCGGNVHKQKVVAVTSSRSRTGKDAHTARNAVDLEATSVFCSPCRDPKADIPDAPNNWICYDFKERKVLPTHYSIRSFVDGDAWVYQGFMKSWRIEVSMNGDGWTVIDKRDNNSLLHRQGVVATFEVERKERCRFVKLVQIGRNTHGDDMLCICAFELFGDFTE